MPKFLSRSEIFVAKQATSCYLAAVVEKSQSVFDLPDTVDQELARSSQRLGELRSERGWTLDELAERSGLSKPFLSRLEAGDRRPSIAAVLTLARVYGVSIGAIFEPSTVESCIVVRGAQAKQRKGDGLIYTPLSSGQRFANLQPIRLTICADRVGDKRYQHEGEEWVYVLAGAVRLALGEKTYELASGDAAHFDSRIPHRLSAMGEKDAEVIVVACPIAEALDPYPGKRFRQKRAIR